CHASISWALQEIYTYSSVIRRSIGVRTRNTSDRCLPRRFHSAIRPWRVSGAARPGPPPLPRQAAGRRPMVFLPAETASELIPARVSCALRCCSGRLLPAPVLVGGGHIGL